MDKTKLSPNKTAITTELSPNKIAITIHICK